MTTPAMPDTDWLPIAGRNAWIVVMRDKRIRSRPRERQALLEHGARTFCLTGAGNYSKWRVLELVVQSWPEMEARAAEDGPYIYALTQAGPRRIV